MENGNKLRLLYIYQYLLRHSDAEHPVSTPELLKYLKDEYNMDVHRTTLPGDIAMMEEAGIHFEIIKSRQNKYYYDDRPFDVPELKLLIDAVSSSKFITEKKSKELIKKLVSLTSDYNVEKLRRHITVEGRIKSENEKAFYILDCINEAIDKNCKVSFQYADYNNRKYKELRHDGEHYIVSPSPTFYRWVFGWNGAMKILGPTNAIDEYKAMARKALEN